MPWSLKEDEGAEEEQRHFSEEGNLTVTSQVCETWIVLQGEREELFG